MTEQYIYSKINLLNSEQFKKELLLFLEFLLSKQFAEKQQDKRVPKFGCAKGTFKMTPDFDEPLEDFKEPSLF